MSWDIQHEDLTKLDPMSRALWVGLRPKGDLAAFDKNMAISIEIEWDMIGA